MKWVNTDNKIPIKSWCENIVIPNAVGVDIGCGMCAVKTNIPAPLIPDKQDVRSILENIKKYVPVAAGRHHMKKQNWDGFDINFAYKGWFTKHTWELAQKSLGTLGGGNHFIELQKGNDGFIWLMLHSGSRNLGYTIAEYYHNIALKFNQKEINIHHNYASKETHFSKEVWVHRKGATSAQKSQPGIIPGSMGTPSYIVEGNGNKDSFCSCSHGAGRVMSRIKASKTLTKEECNKAMGEIVFDPWNKLHHKKSKGLFDLSEAPQAYKNINSVIEAQLDLITPIVKLEPIGVIKG